MTMTGLPVPSSIACNKSNASRRQGSRSFDDDSVSFVSFMDDSSLNSLDDSSSNDDAMFGRDMSNCMRRSRRRQQESALKSCKEDLQLPPLPRRRISMDHSFQEECIVSRRSEQSFETSATPRVSNKKTRSGAVAPVRRMPLPTLSTRQLDSWKPNPMCFKGMVPPKFPKRQSSIIDEDPPEKQDSDCAASVGDIPLHSCRSLLSRNDKVCKANSLPPRRSRAYAA